MGEPAELQHATPRRRIYATRCYDPVTLLPNRRQFLDDVARPQASPQVLVMVTIADGQSYNQIVRALGHARADDFIRAAAARIVEVAGSETTLYHAGMLSFAAVVLGTENGMPPGFVARVLSALAQPVVCDAIPIAARAGIGLKCLDDNGDRGEDLRAALSAVQDSRSMACGWAWYDQQSDKAHVRAFRLLSDLKSALADPGQLHLDFQPKIALATGRCESAEALLRWTHPTLGAISPTEFIPLAEATAFVTPVTRWVIDAATAQLAAWTRDGFDMAVAVNVSPKNFDEPDFVDYLLFCCAARGIDRKRIEIEITEGVSAGQSRTIRDRLETLRHLGFVIAIDDFGSGYSNMSQLTELSAQTLKVDRSLISGMERREKNARLVAGIVKMGQDLGFRVVAEGIETEAERALLAQWGCDFGQGYLFARPMTADALRAWNASRA